MRTRRAGLARLEVRRGERRRLVELDQQLFDGNVGAAEVSKIPLDALARLQVHLGRRSDEVDAAGVLLDVDAYRNRAHRELVQVFRTNQPIGRCRRRGHERRRLGARRRGDE